MTLEFLAYWKEAFLQERAQHERYPKLLRKF